MGIIYCYTNKINNKKYIGQTINPEQRKIQHKSSAFNEKDKDYNTILHRAFRKYGYENFIYEIIAIAETVEELNKLEKFYIKHWNTQTPNGYNILEGGLNASRPKGQETRKKLMESKATLSEEEVVFLRKAYQEKKSPSEIYKQLYEGKMHYNSFLNIWSGQRYKLIMPEIIEENKYRHTKLNEEIVRQIKIDKRDNPNLTYLQLAKKYNISKSTIADILKGRTWKKVQIESVSTSFGSEA